MAAQQVLEQYSGPIPPPEMLRGFDEVVPGSAERVLARWEAQSKHRQQMEAKVVNANIDAQRRGSWQGFVVAMFGLGVAAYLAKLGYPWVAGTLAGGDLLALVGVFVYGKREQRREREQKFNLMYGR